MARPRRPSVDVMERDAQAADLYRQGRSYRQIASQMGYRSPQSVGDAIRRHAATAGGDRLAAAEALQMQLDRLQDYRQQAYKVLNAEHYVISQGGKIVLSPDGETPLVDDGPVLQALDRLLRYDDHEAKLLGLYAPSRSRVEVITLDAIEAEIRKLEAEVANSGRAKAGAPPLPA